jgi:Protein of unknown function (DUF1761)
METTETLNWLAIGVGTVLAYGLGMIWFSPAMFGKRWSRGMNDLQPPEKAPLLAMLVQLAGTFALALVIGITATQDALITAILAVFSVALLGAGSGLFKQNAPATVSIDAGYTLAIGAIMIAAQGIF